MKLACMQIMEWDVWLLSHEFEWVSSFPSFLSLVFIFIHFLLTILLPYLFLKQNRKKNTLDEPALLRALSRQQKFKVLTDLIVSINNEDKDLCLVTSLGKRYTYSPNFHYIYRKLSVWCRPCKAVSDMFAQCSW